MFYCENLIIMSNNFRFCCIYAKVLETYNFPYRSTIKNGIYFNTTGSFASQYVIYFLQLKCYIKLPENYIQLLFYILKLFSIFMQLAFKKEPV